MAKVRWGWGLSYGNSAIVMWNGLEYHRELTKALRRDILWEQIKLVCAALRTSSFADIIKKSVLTHHIAKIHNQN